MNKGYGLVLLTMAITMFLDGLDGTIVEVALPKIAEYFDKSMSDLSWTVSIYYVHLAGLLIIFGKICDMGATKKVLIIGLGLFTLGTFLSGISPDFWFLIGSRALQGIGGAMIAASSFMMTVKYLPKEMIPLGLSVVALGLALGEAPGPGLGAILTEYLSWTWVFHISVPIGVIAILLAHFALPADSKLERSHIDAKGAVLLFAFVFLLMIHVTLIGDGVSWIVGICGIGFIVTFIALIRHLRKTKDPILDLRIFRNRSFNKALVIMFFLVCIQMGMCFILPMTFTNMLGHSTLDSGMILSLSAISTLVCCYLVGSNPLKVRMSTYVTIVCILTIMFSISLMFLKVDSGLTILCVISILLGTLWGLGGGSIGSVMIDVLNEDQKGTGSSMVSFITYFGAAMGTAIMTCLFAFGTGGVEHELLTPILFYDGYVICAISSMVIGAIMLAISISLKRDIERNEYDI